MQNDWDGGSSTVEITNANHCSDAIRHGYQELDRQPSTVPSESSLEEAIRAAPQKQLALLLSQLVQTSEQSRVTACKFLLAPIDGSPSKKRKVNEVCRQCGEDYDVRGNDIGSCTYHPGSNARLLVEA